MKHDWKPCDPPPSAHEWKEQGRAGLAGSILVSEPDDERKWFHCARCGFHYSQAGFGPLTLRSDIGIDGGDDNVHREITGWETEEQGMKRCEVDSDCDVQTATGVMTS